MDIKKSVSLEKPEQSGTYPATGEIHPASQSTSVQPPMDRIPAPTIPQQPIPQTTQQQTAQQPTYYSESVQHYDIPAPQQIPDRGVGYQAPPVENTKFCKFCGSRIPMNAVVCTACGCQVEPLQGVNQGVPTQIIINNTNTNTGSSANTNRVVYLGIPKRKWVAFALCLCFGIFGAHRFYEGKVGTGLLYLCTLGLAAVGVVVDLIIILTKTDPYYV